MDPASLLRDPVIVGAAGGASSVVLLMGALAKLRDLTLFRHAVDDYGLLPAAATPLFAAVFPLAELAAALALALADARGLALALALGVVAVATAGVGVNLLRGRTALKCGCGGGDQRISGALVVRNLLLALLIGEGTRQPSTRSLTTVDAVSWAGALLLLLALNACATQLISNRDSLKEYRS